MKETTITPVDYELETQRKNVAETFNLLIDQCCKLVRNTVVTIYNSPFIQKAILVIQLTSVLVTALYIINFAALAANGFAAAFGGSPSLSMSVQYELFKAGLWFIPFTILFSVSFFKKNL